MHIATIKSTTYFVCQGNIMHTALASSHKKFSMPIHYCVCMHALSSTIILLLIFYYTGDYRQEVVPVQKDLLPGEVLIKVLAAGICAGDAKCYAGAPLFWGM